jgi:DNA modification methylase
MATRILPGDCRVTLREVPNRSVQCVVTSPPYWGLRDYGVEGQIGMEATPEEYVTNLVDVFREVGRVLRDDGVLWLNIGDSYCPDHAQQRLTLPGENYGFQAKVKGSRARDKRGRVPGLKPKDLVGIPWMVALALRAEGWYLRQDIIWSKNPCMPEPVTDRCTRSHEYLFMLARQPRYYYDADAIREPHTSSASVTPWQDKDYNQDILPEDQHQQGKKGRPKGVAGFSDGGRNKRSVWNIATRHYEGAHFAVMPPTLAEPCILAGTSGAGCCPTCGAPWKRVVVHSGNPDGILGYRGVPNTSNTAGSGGRGQGKTPVVHAPNGVRLKPGHQATQYYRGMDTGRWEPSCECPDHTPSPCTVLDPFAGSGTVGMVANWHGRGSILCELNPEYIPLIEKRVTMDRTETGGCKPSVAEESSVDILGSLG